MHGQEKWNTRIHPGAPMTSVGADDFEAGFKTGLSVKLPESHPSVLGFLLLGFVVGWISHAIWVML
jgi:hypothetical protein